MLIVVVTVFLIVEIPLAVITALHIISSAIIEFLDYGVANLFILFANFFIMVSYPINFAIYCGMSRQFRETFKEIFIKRSVSSKKDSSSRYSLVNGQRTCTNETVLQLRRFSKIKLYNSNKFGDAIGGAHGDKNGSNNIGTGGDIVHVEIHIVAEGTVVDTKPNNA